MGNRNSPIMAAMFANAHRGQNSQAVDVTDFLPPECRTREMEREAAMMRKLEEMKRG